jgi:cyclophilin family peptidyl-prolyl cis-trans isomerase
MARRFWVPAAVWAVLVSWVALQQPLVAQDAPAQETPAAAPAQEQPAPPAAAPAQEQPAPPAAAPAQEQPAPAAAAPAAATPAPGDAQQAHAAFEAKLGEWKEALKKLRTLKHDYQMTAVADDAARKNLEQQWTDTLAQANALLYQVADAGIQAYRAAPNDDRELTSFLVKVLQDETANDQYERAAELGNALVDGQCDLPQIYREAGIANFAINNLDRALDIVNKADALSSLSADARALRKSVQQYKEFWKRESELREKEKAADDLPRVKLTTSKGDIVLELFENEAPETVANFLSLVKKGFYDKLTFHRVIAGFMAQGGCPTGDGSGGPGYTIYDECGKPEARQHFRGSISMAKTPAANSGGSQFFICFRPTPELNGQHTVFGRVIEGMEVLGKIQRRDSAKKDQPEPDTIIKAEVLRDRGHEYLPHKVE